MTWHASFVNVEYGSNCVSGATKPSDFLFKINMPLCTLITDACCSIIQRFGWSRLKHGADNQERTTPWRWSTEQLWIHEDWQWTRCGADSLTTDHWTFNESSTRLSYRPNWFQFHSSAGISTQLPIADAIIKTKIAENFENGRFICMHVVFV